MTNLKHIAFIIDGNRRWAKKRGLPAQLGHREGMKAVERTLLALCEEGVPYASFFCFSTENWKRGKDEIDALFNLVEEYFDNGLEFFNKNGIKVDIFGDISAFPKKMQKVLLNAKEVTASNTKLHAGFCLNYGGKEDIVQAVNKLIASGKKEVTAADISRSLHTSTYPDPDLLIRTSGEERISNFQLWQLAYSEMYFPKTLWPDFDKKQLKKSLKVFSKRNRRFGGN